MHTTYNIHTVTSILHTVTRNTLHAHMHTHIPYIHTYIHNAQYTCIRTRREGRGGNSTLTLNKGTTNPSKAEPCRTDRRLSAPPPISPIADRPSTSYDWPISVADRGGIIDGVCEWGEAAERERERRDVWMGVNRQLFSSLGS